MKIEVKGTIVSEDDKALYEWFGMNATAPSDIVLPEDENEEVVVEINSPGGDVFAGSEIYTKLRGYVGNVKVEIVGIAASAASVVAMAGNHISISPTAQMMIHNASSNGGGNQHDHEHLADILDKLSGQIAESYSNRTGRPVDDFKKLMDEETWFTAKEAVENGLADEVMFQNDKQEQPMDLVAGFGVLSAKTKARIREMMTAKQEPNAQSNVDTESLVGAMVERLKAEMQSENKKLFKF